MDTWLDSIYIDLSTYKWWSDMKQILQVTIPLSATTSILLELLTQNTQLYRYLVTIKASRLLMMSMQL